jgi:D-alanine-D-alanine ligase
MDFRLDANGNCFVLEANANPHLAFGEDLAESAKVAGLEYPDLVQRILNLGLRWEPERAG